MPLIYNQMVVSQGIARAMKIRESIHFAFSSIPLSLVYRRRLAQNQAFVNR